MDNRQWLINGNPKGRPLEASDFKLETSSLGSLAAESARVRVEYLSFDPSQKGQMENIGYAAATEMGQVMRGRLGSAKSSSRMQRVLRLGTGC